MSSQDFIPKRKKWTTVALYFLSFVLLAGLIVWSLFATSRWVLAESYLGNYVRVAGKAHASLNFQRGRTQLLSPEEVHASERTIGEGYVHTNFPVSTKWDRLYLETYNERMRSHLSTNTPQSGK